MTRQTTYIPLVSAAFSAFLDGQLEPEDLIARLREAELQVMHDDAEEEVTGKVLWFRFFEGDPLETTISDIEKDLRDTAHPNYRILLQGIALGLESGELEVYYS